MKHSKTDAAQPRIHPDETFGLLNTSTGPRLLLDSSHVPGSSNVVDSLAPPSDPQQHGLQGFQTLPSLQHTFGVTRNSNYDLLPMSSTSAFQYSDSQSPYQPHDIQRQLNATSSHAKFDSYCSKRETQFGSPHSTFDPTTFYQQQRIDRQSSPGTSSQHSYSSGENSGRHGPAAAQHQVKRSRRETMTYPQQHSGTKKSCSMSPTDDKEDSRTTCSSRCTGTPPVESAKKQNHSEIEKRRRDKMNTYITELSRMVPVCGGSSRKLDKLTVLRMAVEHMRNIRGAESQCYSEKLYKPAFLSDTEVNQLLSQAADGFLFVVGCDRGRLLYVSESVSQVLNFHQSELLGQSWFDILHPKDVAKVKEQLNDLAPRGERLLVDIRTMLPVRGNHRQHHWGSRLCPGARRAFFCRMKCKPRIDVKQEAGEVVDPHTTETNHYDCFSSESTAENSQDKKYSIVYCTGYMKPWPRSEKEASEGDKMEEQDTGNLSCLIAVGRILPSLRYTTATSTARAPITFSSRHAADGRFVFVDHRATLIHGYLPQELIGSSMYGFYHAEDVAQLAQVHKSVLSSNSSEPELTTPMYRFRTADSSFIVLQSQWSIFRNPFTRDIECLLATNTLIASDDSSFSELQETTTLSKNVDHYGEPERICSYLDGLSKDIIQGMSSPCEPATSSTVTQERTAEDEQSRIFFSTDPRNVAEFGSTSASSPNPTEINFPNLASPVTSAGQYKSPYTSVEIQSLDAPRRPSPSSVGIPSSLAALLNSSEDEMSYLMDCTEGGLGSAVPQASVGGSTLQGNEDTAMSIILSLLEGNPTTPEPSDMSWSLP